MTAVSALNSQMMVSQAMGQSSDNAAIQTARRMDDALKGKSAEELETVGKEFEAMFLSEMLKPMFNGIEAPQSFGGGGPGEDAYKGLMIQEYGKMISAQGGIGIADMIKGQLIQIQGGHQ